MQTTWQHMTKRERAREIMRLTRERIAGGITQAQLAAAVNDILTPEPELPLGIGAMMPEKEVRP